MKSSKSLSNKGPDPAPRPSWPIITLTTDFGLGDYFVGSVKGVLLERAPGSRLVDITHFIPRHDVLSAAFVINEAYRYFPAGSIHLAVVDPGVGTERREIIALHEGHFFVAPDNGLLTYIFQKGKTEVYQIQANAFLPLKESATFAGRDRFAPAAALLAKGVEAEALGRPITDYHSIEGLSPRREGDDLVGKIVYFDHFGNALTNLTGSVFKEGRSGEAVCVSLRGARFQGLKKNYAEGRKRDGNLIVNSSDRLEVFVSGGSAKDLLKLKLLDDVYLKHFFGT
jgi:S-adenosyl-L-methionine hydrolase (adenosine-forming)